MKGVNKVILVGNLGQEPEIQYLPGKIAKARFTLATNEGYKNKSGEWIERTEWHRIVLWREQAEVASKYLHKGSKVYLEGRLHSRTWEDKTHQKRTITEIIVENLVLLGKEY